MDFQGIKPGESLACFIDRVVNPDTSYLKQCGKTIDEVAEVLKSSQFNYRVMRTIKGGSIGKGTAVRDLSDVDLIFPIYDITSVLNLKQQMDGIKIAIDSLLRSRFQISGTQTTTWAYKTNILVDRSWQEVDIMPILNITNDPSKLTDDEIKMIHTKMRGEAGIAEKGYYNRCLRPLQVEFIGKHPEKIKRVIRLIKYWIKTKNHTIIKSIAVELLVIGAWEDLGKPHPGVAEEVISKMVFDKLRNFGDIKLSWTNYYKPTDYQVPPMDFKEIEPDESLSCFIDRVVNPDAEYLTQCGKTIDEVAKVLKSSEFDYKVMRTIKGGSIGKGTAVRGLSDVDLIFPLSDITTVEALKQKMDGIQDAIHSLLKSKVNRWQTTTWSCNTDISIDGSWQEVDIMPILNIAKDPSNLTDKEIKSIHTKMSETGNTEKGYYNRCLRPLQIRFIGKHEEKIKRVIRLIKYWIKTNDHIIIKSIAVELLVIRSWEDLGKPDSDVAEETISQKVFEILRDFGNIRVSWSTYYEPADYLHEISSKPYILDPVDPYNNVISEITNHYCAGSHVPEADKAVMKQVNRLQSDAERAFNSFK